MQLRSREQRRSLTGSGWEQRRSVAESTTADDAAGPESFGYDGVESPPDVTEARRLAEMDKVSAARSALNSCLPAVGTKDTSE